jgi:hypothetical protein
VGEASVPVAFELVKKTRWVFDKKKEKKWRRKSPTTKNEHYRPMLRACLKNRIGFRYVLNDVWYASSENMRYVKEELAEEFIMPLKTNRRVALSLEEKRTGDLRASWLPRTRTEQHKAGLPGASAFSTAVVQAGPQERGW